MDAVTLSDKLAQFGDHWKPRIIGRYNGNDLMVVKAHGQFNWHSHPDTDDLFLVLRGSITVQLRDRDIQLKAGDLLVVPAGIEHRPVAAEEAHLLLIEPSGTPNTGDPATAAVKASI